MRRSPQLPCTEARWLTEGRASANGCLVQYVAPHTHSFPALCITKATNQITFFLTSHSELGDTGNKTVYFLWEIVHPYHVLTNAGFEIDFVSPQGSNASMDPTSHNLDDSVNAAFRVPGYRTTVMRWVSTEPLSVSIRRKYVPLAIRLTSIPCLWRPSSSWSVTVCTRRPSMSYRWMRTC